MVRGELSGSCGQIGNFLQRHGRHFDESILWRTLSYRGALKLIVIWV
jgi:hypothetical protein